MAKRHYAFTADIRDKAFARQWNSCAACGASMIDLEDHAHHVVPNQAGNPDDPEDAFIGTVENCVVLCYVCHERYHENGRYKNGAVGQPEVFTYSHGRESAKHAQWVVRLNALIARKYAHP